jgi:hypothetical protein
MAGPLTHQSLQKFFTDFGRSNVTFARYTEDPSIAGLKDGHVWYNETEKQWKGLQDGVVVVFFSGEFTDISDFTVDFSPETYIPDDPEDEDDDKIIAHLNGIDSKLNELQATWDGTRFFAVDYDNGNDGNVGYSDTSLALAGSVAIKTLERLDEIFPKIGNGRTAVVAIRARIGGATYRNQADTADDVLDFLNGVTGYQQIVVRGTDTVASAGAVAFANDTADKISCGGKIVPGTNVAGYNPTGAPSVSVFDCVLAGGGAPGLSAEPALLGKRIRFDSATTTVALRNICRMIHANDTDTITMNVDLPAVPVATDVFYIEEPGVAIDAIVANTGNATSLALPPSFSNSGVMIVGFRSANAGASHIALTARALAGRIQLAFVDLASPFTGAISFSGPVRVTISPSYLDEATPPSTITVGPGLRVVGWGTFASVDSLIMSSVVNSAGRMQLLNIGPGLSVGSASYAALGYLFQNCMAGGVSGTTLGGNSVGNNASTTARRFRVTGAFAGAAISCTTSNLFIRGVDFASVGSAACIVLNGVGLAVGINDCVGTTGNTGPGLSLLAARGCEVLLGNLNANTFGGAAGADILGFGSVRYVHADYARTDLRDHGGNHLQGTAGSPVGTTTLVTNDAATSIGQYQVVRATGFGIGTLARANTAANATGVIGVSQGIATAAPAQATMLVNGGGTWLQFDAAPTTGAIAYLSTATAGNAQHTVPALSGTNQKLRLGRIAAVLGTLGFVVWHPENLPVLADGLA